MDYPACDINKNDYGLDIIFETKNIKFDKSRYELGESIKIHNKPYTDNAYIIQSILEYSNKIKVEDRFTAEELTEYIVQPRQSKCKVFETEYSGMRAKTKIDARVGQHIEDINTIIRKLVYLKLIEVLNEQKHCNKYMFTNLGRMIGALLLYKKNKIKDENELVEKIVDFYDSLNHLSAKFFSIFVRKCIDTKVFDQVVNSLFSSLELAASGKVASLSQIKKINPVLSKESWPKLEESFIEFDKREPFGYEILFYNLKLVLERVQECKSANFKGFEKLRQYSCANPFAITIEGYCKECNMFIPCVVGIIHYFRSYANRNLENSQNHLKVMCNNPACKKGFLDFEFIDNIKFIREIPNDKEIKRGEKFQVNVFESQLDNLGTIFEQDAKGDFSLKSRRLQRIILFLYENQDKSFKPRRLLNEILELDPTLFIRNKAKETTKKVSPEDFYYQFQSLLNYLNFFDIVEFRESQGYKTKGLVKEYKLTQFGKVISLLAKSYGNLNENSIQLHNEIYQSWRGYHESPPISSLDLFCIEYFQKCEEQGLFGDILSRFKNSLLNKSYLLSFNKIDLYSEIVLPIFDYTKSIDNETEINNTKLWKLWYQSLENLGNETGVLFLHHIKMYLTRRIENSVHDIDRYEIERFSNRFNNSYVTTEAICTNCFRGYFYLSIPVITYVGYLFGPNEDELFILCKDKLSKDIEGLQCNECGTHILDHYTLITIF